MSSCYDRPQAFSDYQIQQMTANFVDQFGFNDEEFSEHDENIKYVKVPESQTCTLTWSLCPLLVFVHAFIDVCVHS